MSTDENYEQAASSGSGLDATRQPTSKNGPSAPFVNPSYFTVGSGSKSEHADRLTEILDSGYGGSSYGGDAPGWQPGLTPDMPTPVLSSRRPGDPIKNSEHDRRTLASHIHQLYYNQNRAALARAISQTVETLKKLQEMNSTWPAHYPSVQQPTPHSPPVPSEGSARPGLLTSRSTVNHLRMDHSTQRPLGIRRTETFQGTDDSGESSSAAASKPISEPRLVTPQLAQDFSVLKIDLKLGSMHQADLVHSLEKSSIAALLDSQIRKSMRHLMSLRDRIEDTSSKVLVTGDLNAGKSTFCNALLRRKILPEDQQPCTSIFCEVLDVRENGGFEEVHAIPIGVSYNRNDERTYEVYTLNQLESVVTDSDRYSQCKIFIEDARNIDESLLNNGVVDIALIDAPGLNADSVKTTALFARQEEIDVVVFVVSAANHFTLSAKDFIFSAAREKAFMFMVVNGFDNINDKERCQETILKQVASLSPATFKESSELVHFVSSNAIPVSHGQASNAGDESAPFSAGGKGKANGDPDGDDPDPSEDKGKGKKEEVDEDKLRDFEDLEASLRRFVLEKRARSKLAPAKTYLLNVLGDIHNLATINQEVAQSEIDRVSKELLELQPVCEQAKASRTKAAEDADHIIENTAAEVYNHTRDTLNTSISSAADRDLGVPYPGLIGAFAYAEAVKSAMIEEISQTVFQCEEQGRQRTSQGVNVIKSLGMFHLGDAYTDFTFRADKMFKRRKDALARQVDVEVEVWDFFDFAYIFDKQEKVAGTSMAVTVAGVVGTQMIGGVGWFNGALSATRVLGSSNLRRLIVPGLVLGVILVISYAVSSIPQSLPRRISSKLSAQLAGLDYSHANALRISSEVRRALKYPADNLRIGLQRSVEKLQSKQEETAEARVASEVARKFFAGLVRESNATRHGVERVDLEGPAPGVAAAFDS